MAHDIKRYFVLGGHDSDLIEVVNRSKLKLFLEPAEEKATLSATVESLSFASFISFRQLIPHS